ncbi:hypothetical protein [Stenotrophomonas sp. G4]|uniref:hypothetical protein n=1 Tax=Stenotrophomonas sp. G4 TaxID=2303750 RepID=UPI000E3D5C56|nr:hypothetical protein [Stenotrophomonas sp. G4]
MAQSKARWSGTASWSGGAVGLAAQSAGLAGVGLTVAPRVRRERWPWIGLGGAVLIALPLLICLLRMMLKRQG